MGHLGGERVVGAALIVLAALVLGVGTLNISLGQAIEPAWFTLLEMIVGSALILIRAVSKGQQRAIVPDSSP